MTHPRVTVTPDELLTSVLSEKALEGLQASQWSTSELTPSGDIFTTAPGPVAQFVADSIVCDLAKSLRGRLGVVVFLKGEDLHVDLAFAPAWTGLDLDPLTLTEDDLLTPLTKHKIPKLSFVGNDGEEFSLKEALFDLFSAYPTKPLRQGGAAIERRKAQWRGVLSEAQRSPALTLLSHFNARFASEEAEKATLIDVREFWVGASPTWSIRHSGTSYAPLSAFRPLFDRLMPKAGFTRSPLWNTEAPELPVLYEDDVMIVINKPSRLASVPGVREALNAKHLLEKTYGELHVVHRLDLDTSGVLLFAKTKDALKVLNTRFRERDTEKVYVARLEGVVEPKGEEVNLPIAVNPWDRPRQCVLSETGGGKASLTHVKLLGVETHGNVQKTLVELTPHTGRTHQLRVHCAHPLGLGSPIDGDSFYGHLGQKGEDANTRLCLHAKRLVIAHPVTEEMMVFEAEPEFPSF